MSESVVIVGAGHAGGLVAAGLAQAGYDGEITLVGAEPYPPYQRPPLSKAYLNGEISAESLALKPMDFYAKKGVRLLIGRSVRAIDREGASVLLDDGTPLPYGRLVLATGARARTLSLPGADLAGVYSLRTLTDADTLASVLKTGAALVIVGGGYVGLELAASAVKRGLRVTVLEQAPRVMARTASPEVSAYFEGLHRGAGVDIVTNVKVAALVGMAGHVRAVHSEDGRVWSADCVVAGIGAVPEQGLAEAARLACDDGIVVDEHCRTEDPRIFAAGDCTRHRNPLLACTLHLESVHNATSQARTVVAQLMGRPKPYAEIPWFWSDQYDVRLQIAGLPGMGDERLLRGDPSGGGFSVLHFSGGRLLALEAVNRPQDFLAAKRLIPHALQVPAEVLRDPEIPLSRFLPMDFSKVPG